MKKTVYHAIIAVGLVSAGFLFWFFTAPASNEKISVEELRQLLREGTTDDQRALGAAGLGERRDVASLPALLDAMDAESPLLRGQASVAVRKILGADYEFDPAAPPDKRQRIVSRYRDLWKAWQLKHSGSGESPPTALAVDGGD